MDAKYIGLYTIIKKEATRIRRIWAQTLFPSVITMTLYFVIFGNLIGSRIGKMAGFNYVTFIVPGLIMMSVITNSFSNVVSSFFSAKFQHSIEEVLISPIPDSFIIIGYISGGVIRGIIISILVTGVSLFFSDLKFYNIAIVISVIVLTAILFSLAGFLNALFAKRYDDVSIFPTFILSPLTYLGGVFYSIDLLPPIWRTVSKFNPILYMINAFRYGYLGFSDIDIVFAISFIIIFIVILFSLSLYLMRKGYGLKQ
ncbi:ABC transporter permease [Spirochaetota bacterium]